MPLPVTIVAGFLGAGKTTALRELIMRNNGRKLGVIVNDFAALNIDADLVRSVHSDVVALHNGCICCSIRDELPEAIERLLEAGPIDAIYVETSGVSLPHKIVASLSGSPVASRIRVFGVYCIVDTHAFEALDYQDTELAIDQAAAADLVVFNKLDLASADQLERVRATIAAACPTVAIMFARDGLSDRSAVLDFDAFEAVRSGHAGNASRDPRPDRAHVPFASFSWTSVDALDLAEIRERILAIPRSVVRAKGVFLPSDRPDAVAIFNKVGNRSTLDLMDRDADAMSHRLVAIAHESELDAPVLGRLFPRHLPFPARVSDGVQPH